MAMILGVSGFAQEALYVTYGDTTNAPDMSTCPLPGYYGYHRSAVLYTANELSLPPGSLVTDLAWQTASTTNGTQAPFHIYLLETSDNEIPGTTVWSELVSSATLVYSGTCEAPSFSWANFTLTTPFTYNGGNLVVITDGVGCSASGSCSKSAKYTGTNNTQAWMLCQDNSAMSDAATLATAASSTTHYKFNLLVGYEQGSVSCNPVSGLTVGNINTNNAMITWTEPNDGGSYLIQYKTSSESWDSPEMTEDITTSTIYTFDNNLDNNTIYNFRVANLCSNGDTSAWNAVTFKTLCGALDDLPLFYDFETFDASTLLPYCWERAATSSSTNPQCYDNTYNAYAGSYSLYMFNSDNIALLPAIDENAYGLNELQLRFMLREGYSNVTVVVGFMSHPGSQFVPYDTVTLPNNGYPLEYEEQTVRFDEYDGPHSRIALKVLNGTVYIDNLYLEPIPGCPPVQDITATSIDAESATITWTGTSESYLVRYRVANTSVWNVTDAVVNGNTATLSGLAAQTTYEVQIAPDCPETTEDSYRGITFLTGCTSFDLPYTINFEDASALNCWTVAEEGLIAEETYPQRTLFFAHNSIFCEVIGAQAGYHTVWAAPKMNGSIENLRLEFYSRVSNPADVFGTFTVGLMTNPSDTATYVAVDTIPVNNVAHTLNVVNFLHSGFTGYDYYIAFRYDGAGNADVAGKIYVDDIAIMVAPACLEPSNVQANNVTANSADITWTSNGSEFTLYHREAGETTFTAVENLTNLSYTLAALSPSTTYEVYVATVCDNGTESASQTISFTTGCAVETAPYTENFESTSWPALSLPGCWRKYTGLASDAFSGTAPTPFNGGWEISNAQVLNGYHAKLNIFGVPVRYWLVSPEINLSNLENPALTFDLALTAYGTTNPITTPGNQQDDIFMVIISTDNGATWSESNATVWSNAENAAHIYDNIPYDGMEVTIPLSDYAGQTICIAFYGQSTLVGGDNDLHIDNVHVGEQVACTRPQELNAIPAQTSATLSWTSTAPVFTLRYKTAETDWQWVNDVTLDDGYYELSGLTPSTTYEWYVETACGGEELASNHAYFTTLMPDTTPVIVITEPTVTTNPATNITKNSVTISATITNPDHVEITGRGFVVRNNATGTETNYPADGTGEYFASELTGLTSSTSYTFNAYIIYNDTTVHGQELTFVTLIDGIDDYLSSRISLYPNPAKEYVNVE